MACAEMVGVTLSASACIDRPARLRASLSLFPNMIFSKKTKDMVDKRHFLLLFKHKVDILSIIDADKRKGRH